jgi:integral membrane sensor domain MASE1
MFGDCSMDTEDHRLGLARQVRYTQWPLFTLDSRLGNVDNFTHSFSSFSVMDFFAFMVSSTQVVVIRYRMQRLVPHG